MRRLLLLALLLCPLIMAKAACAQSPPPARVALLIGNQGYTDAVGPLRNPHRARPRVPR